MAFFLGNVLGMLIGGAIGCFVAIRWYAARLKRIMPEMPHFGAPELRVYHPVDYPAPLHCTTGVRCNPDEPIKAGERFWVWNVSNHPDGKFVVVCWECSEATPIAS